MQKFGDDNEKEINRLEEIENGWFLIGNLNSLRSAFVSGFQWTGVPNVIVYSQDNDGDENHRLYKLNITKVAGIIQKTATFF